MEENSNDSSSGHWRGSSLEEIWNGSSEKWKLNHIGPVEANSNHKVLFHLPIPTNIEDSLVPQRGKDKWDSDHVKLPCSPQSQYQCIDEAGKQTLNSRWELIETTLLQPILSSHDLEKAIKSYNTRYENIWNFRGLHKLFDDCEEEEAVGFFQHLLPKIINLALRLPSIIQSSIPLLKQGCNRSISLSQQQVACLLANAFLCTFPRRNTDKRNAEYASYPDINFNRLFQTNESNAVEKLQCICNYFRRVCRKMPNGVITFQRNCVNQKDLPKWENCDLKFSGIKLHVSSMGKIETHGDGMLQVDFANKFVGGGVLGSGCVQEEIRFVICPELIVSRLFTEALKPQEALLIIGAEQFNSYSGYSRSFEWAGDFIDQTPRDSFRRIKTGIVAIDALMFRNKSDQFKEALMTRELNKAYVGFQHHSDTKPTAIASGNWGCGAFGGEALLKSLIQLIVCCYCGRDLVYFTFGDEELMDQIYGMYKFLKEKDITVAQLWEQLKQFEKKGIQSGGPKKLFSFIYQQYDKNKMKINPKNNTLFKFLATSSKFKFMKKSNVSGSETNSEPLAKEKEKNSEIQLSPNSKELQAIFEEDLPDENLESKEKRKFSSIASNASPDKKATPPSSQGPGLLDMFDSYYDSLTEKQFIDDEASTSQEIESNPAKKHCPVASRIPEPLQGEEFKQKCSTMVASFFASHSSGPNESEFVDNGEIKEKREVVEVEDEVLEPTETQESSEKLSTPSTQAITISDSDEIPGTPENCSNAVGYLARRSQMMQASKDSDDDIPSSQEPVEIRPKKISQKLKITNFFKRHDKK